MSRADEMIAHLCPDGVEFRPLGEIGTFVRGNGMPRKDLSESGVGAIHYGDIYTHLGTWTTQPVSFIAPEKATKLRAKVDPGDVVFTNTSENIEDVCKAVAWLGDSQIVTGGHASVLKHDQDPRFISYVTQTPNFHLQKRRLATGTKVMDVSASRLARIRIPVPPIEVQHEVVRVLDVFQQLIAALEAELIARHQQYEHYRSSLMSFEDNPKVQWVPLGEVAKNLDSKRKPVTKAARVSGRFPYYGASGIVDYVDDYLFDGDYLLVSEDGANLLTRSTPIAFSVSGKVWVNNHAHVLEFNSYATRRLVEAYLNQISLGRYLSVAAQPKLTQRSLSRIPVPIPPQPEQERIVAILDRFDALVNDPSVGIPAELVARRKQFEYYRDRLFDFEEAS